MPCVFVVVAAVAAACELCCIELARSDAVCPHVRTAGRTQHAQSQCASPGMRASCLRVQAAGPDGLWPMAAVCPTACRSPWLPTLDFDGDTWDAEPDHATALAQVLDATAETVRRTGVRETALARSIDSASAASVAISRSRRFRLERRGVWGSGGARCGPGRSGRGGAWPDEPLGFAVSDSGECVCWPRPWHMAFPKKRLAILRPGCRCGRALRLRSCSLPLRSAASPPLRTECSSHYSRPLLPRVAYPLLRGLSRKAPRVT